MSIFECERTSREVVMYALCLYFPGLNSRSTSKAIQPFGDARRSHAAIWNGFRNSPKRLYRCKRVSAFLIDETMLHIGTDEAWLWVAVELI